MKIRKLISLALALGLIIGTIACAQAVNETDTTSHTITLSSNEDSDGNWSHTAAVDGQSVNEYDYTWHADPSEAHDEVKNAPAEYYTGTEPDDESVYIAHDIFYWPELPVENFQRVNYDGEQEWVYYYTAEGYEDYIFATLPVSGNSVPTDMMHSAEEAYENAVLHITEAGTYILEGDWHGQIWIDLGDTDDTFADPEAKVTVILNGVDVTCTVAPALVFYSVYECDNTWEDRDTYSAVADTSDAGANVIIADGTENNFTGANIYRMLKTTYKSGQEDAAVPVQKKLRKTDAAFYSYVSMNIDGEDEGTGILNITAGYEGLDTELHLSINGGHVNIFSQDDGINVNEDGVSVVSFNGGMVHIMAGLGSEGDGVDSNGFLAVNGGTVISIANPTGDSGLDSDNGSYINGGTVVALGSTMDWAESDDSNDSGQVTMNLQFSAAQSSDEAIIVTDMDGNVVFAFDPDKDEVAGAQARNYRGAILSFPDLTEGESYYIYVGGNVYGEETAGVYDVSTVTGFSAEAKQQCYVGTFNAGGRPEMGGGQRPDGETGDIPDGQIPDGENGGMPDGQMPDGEIGDGQFPDRGQRPDGETGDIPDGQIPDGENGGMPDGGETEVTVAFYMEDKVNNFSSVSDYSGSSDGSNPSGGTDGTDSNPDTPNADDNDGVGAPFTDVSEDAYYANAVTWAVANGITEGYADGTFRPSNDCTRAQVLTFLWRTAGSPEPDKTAASPFTDVQDESAYYYQAVLWGVEQGITTGKTADTFAPDDTITRAQAVTFLYRYDGKPEPDGGSAFTDVDSSAYYTDAVAWAVNAGVTNGKTDTAFAPDDTCTRAHIVSFLYRANEQ